jgi:hypothetical protein
MPLLHIAGISNTKKPFTVAMYFLSGESYEDFLWALEAFKRVMCNSQIKIPHWILTDDCLAMRKAINEQFPGIPVGLCQFHISRAIKAKTRVAFKKTEDLTQDDILEQRTVVKQFWNRVGLARLFSDSCPKV